MSNILTSRYLVAMIRLASTQSGRKAYGTGRVNEEFSTWPIF